MCKFVPAHLPAPEILIDKFIQCFIHEEDLAGIQPPTTRLELQSFMQHGSVWAGFTL